MSKQNHNHNDMFDHLPDELQRRVTQSVSRGDIRAVAPFDLSEKGDYLEAYLVLTDDKLGEFVRHNGDWRSRWLTVDDYSDAKIIEGLGMNLMRLLEDGQTQEEFRFTLRFAKNVARLHRRLEKQLTGVDDDGDQSQGEPHADEKKIRCDKCDRVIPPWSDHCPACMSRRKVLGRLLDFVKPYKTRAIIGVIMALIVMVLTFVPSIIRKPMVDIGLGGSGSAPAWDVFLVLFAVWAGQVLLLALLNGVQSRVMAGLGSRVSRDMRQSVYAHLHKLALSFFARKQTGSLVSRVTSDTERMWDFVTFTIVEVGISILTIVGAVVVMLFVNWRLALFALAPLPLMTLMTVFFHKRMQTVHHRVWHRWAQMSAVIADALPGVRVIKAFTQEKREINRFNERSSRVYDEEMTIINLWTTFGPLMRFCTHLGLLITWVVGGLWVARDYSQITVFNDAELPIPAGLMTIGTLLLFDGLMNQFYRPIHMIAHMDRMFNRAATSAQRIFEVLDTQPTVFSKSDPHKPDTVHGRIELRNVSFSYDGIRRVLKNINLKIEPGHMIGLAGPSGGGKTTLINLICRFYDVLEGDILIDGVSVRDYDIHALRSRVGVVLQDPFLFHGTVAENVAYGNPDATIDQIIRATKAANAHDFIVGFPDGYDTQVGERGHTLSGGERQRISIARAILNDPAILILDEATSSVDTESEALIQQALSHLIANRTVIAIAHRLSTLRKADRLVILENGELIEEGSHEELAGKEGGLYAKLLKMQTDTQAIMSF